MDEKVHRASCADPDALLAYPTFLLCNAELSGELESKLGVPIKGGQDPPHPADGGCFHNQIPYSSGVSCRAQELLKSWLSLRGI